MEKVRITQCNILKRKYEHAQATFLKKSREMLFLLSRKFPPNPLGFGGYFPPLLWPFSSTFMVSISPYFESIFPSILPNYHVLATTKPLTEHFLFPPWTIAKVPFLFLRPPPEPPILRNDKIIKGFLHTQTQQWWMHTLQCSCSLNADIRPSTPKPPWLFHSKQILFLQGCFISFICYICCALVF